MDTTPKGTPLTPYETDLVNLGLHVARSAAKRRHSKAPHALELDDLLSMAYYGLCQSAKRWLGYCADKTAERETKQAEYFEETGKHFYPPEQVRYDPGRTDFFLVYASKRCDGAIMDELRARDYATRSLRTKLKKIREAGQDAGVPLAELAETTGMKVSEVARVINEMNNRPVSLEAEGADFETVQTMESDKAVSDLLKVLVASISALTPEQQVVLALHYYQTAPAEGGKKMVHGLQLQAVARKLKVPEGLVSDLHTSAVLEVNEKMHAAAMRNYYDE